MPIALIWVMKPGIWRYDQHAREQMTQLVAQVVTLERIWQTPQRD